MIVTLRVASTLDFPRIRLTGSHMTMTKLSYLTLASALSFAAGLGASNIASADDQPIYVIEQHELESSNGSTSDHTGFHARALFGFGYAGSFASGQVDGVDVDVSVDAFGIGFALQGGYAVMPNLIVGAEFEVLGLVGGSATASSNQAEFDWDTSGSVVFFGPNVTYYLMPIDMYLSGTLGPTFVDGENEYADGSSADTDFDVGFGFNLTVGKEWSVSDLFGVGVAAQLMFSTNEPEGGRDNYNTIFVGVLGSASLN